jgi:hypothetical protein
MTTPVLVCAPAADALVVARGTVYAHNCSRCSRQVAMAPSGQAFMKRNPGALIICLCCFKEIPEAEHAGWIQADGTTSDDYSAVKNEMQDIVPNDWRNRN